MPNDASIKPQHEQQEKYQRQRNAPCQRLDGVRILTFALQQVEQGGEKAADDKQQHDNNDYF